MKQVECCSSSKLTFLLIKPQYGLEMLFDIFSRMAVWYPNSAIGITFSTIRPIEGRVPWSWHSGSILDVDETWPRSDERSFRDASKDKHDESSGTPCGRSQNLSFSGWNFRNDSLKVWNFRWIDDMNHETTQKPTAETDPQLRCSVDFPQITEICERFIKSWWLREIWRPQNMVFGSCVMTTVDVKRHLKSQRNIDTPLTQACAHYHMTNARYKSYKKYLCLYFVILVFLLYLYWDKMHIVRFPPLYKPMAQVGAAAVRAEGSGGRVGHGPARTEVLELETGGGASVRGRILRGFRKWWVFPPKLSIFSRDFHYRSSILGVPLFLETSTWMSRWKLVNGYTPVGYFTLEKTPFISRLKPIDPSHWY